MWAEAQPAGQEQVVRLVKQEQRSALVGWSALLPQAYLQTDQQE
jgi:hypothetical protein